MWLLWLEDLKQKACSAGVKRWTDGLPTRVDDEDTLAETETQLRQLYARTSAIEKESTMDLGTMVVHWHLERLLEKALPTAKSIVDADKYCQWRIGELCARLHSYNSTKDPQALNDIELLLQNVQERISRKDLPSNRRPTLFDYNDPTTGESLLDLGLQSQCIEPTRLLLRYHPDPSRETDFLARLVDEQRTDLLPIVPASLGQQTTDVYSLFCLATRPTEASYKVVEFFLDHFESVEQFMLFDGPFTKVLFSHALRFSELDETQEHKLASIVELLVDHGAKYLSPHAPHGNALGWAIAYDHSQVANVLYKTAQRDLKLDRLLENGCSVHDNNVWGQEKRDLKQTVAECGISPALLRCCGFDAGIDVPDLLSVVPNKKENAMAGAMKKKEGGDT